MSRAEARAAARPAIGFFERYLTVWVALCIVAGVILGQLLPGAFQALGRMAGARRGSREIGLVEIGARPARNADAARIDTSGDQSPV